MKSKYKKTILFAFLFFIFITLLLPAIEILAQKELETTYPEVGGIKIETIETPITKYVKYIFNFAIAFVGLIAFGVLVWSGIQYFTSAGKADVIKAAKSRFKATFLGILILLFSYLILITINPQLVIFHLPGLPETPTEELPETPISPLITTDLLGRIKEMAETIKEIPDQIKSTAEKIKELTNKCDCENTQPLCLCTGGSSSDSCKPYRCFAGPGSNPCPDFEEIKGNQKKIIAQRDEIFYYINRALAEKKDLELDITEVLEKKIDWYNEQIAIEEEQRMIDSLKEEKKWLEEEKKYKEELIDKLKELAGAIVEVKNPTTELSKLPDECLVNVKNKCNASCKGKCHDYTSGCQPDKCSGGNPCPTNKIQEEVGRINPDEINSICDEIISIIEGIKETQERGVQI